MRLLSFPTEELFKQLKAGKRAYQLLDAASQNGLRARTICKVVFKDCADSLPLPSVSALIRVLLGEHREPCAPRGAHGSRCSLPGQIRMTANLSERRVGLWPIRSKPGPIALRSHPPGTAAGQASSWRLFFRPPHGGAQC